jgi:hypothetical protein
VFWWMWYFWWVKALPVGCRGYRGERSRSAFPLITSKDKKTFRWSALTFRKRAGKAHHYKNIMNATALKAEEEEEEVPRLAEDMKDTRRSN